MNADELRDKMASDMRRRARNKFFATCVVIGTIYAVNAAINKKNRTEED
jgi:hypothetical protein